MENIKENISRCEELARPREKVDRNIKVDPFKVKRRALSYRITDSLNTLARPRKLTFDDERVIPRVPKILPIKDSERHAKLCVALPIRGALANSLISRRKNQQDLGTYSQMAKRDPLSYRISDSLNNPRRPTRTSYQGEPSSNYSLSRASKIRSISEGGNCEKTSIRNRVRNHLNLDAYAEMVANNNKQCPDRIKRLAIPRRPYSNTFEDTRSTENNWSFGDTLI